MEYPDSGVGLSIDRPLYEHALFDSQALASEESKLRVAANPQTAQLETFLDLPDPFLKVEQAVASNLAKPAVAEPDGDEAKHQEREEKRARKEEHKEWWEVAGDWVSGAVDVGTQVVVGAFEEVVEAVTERPMETLGMLAGGVALGVVICAAAPVATFFGAGAVVLGGITLATDALVVCLTTAGALHAGNSVIKAVEEAAPSADILMNKAEYSIAEIQAAREDVQDKTGAAAIEGGFSLVTAPFAVGNAVRLVKGPGNYFKIKPTAAGEEQLAMVDDSSAGAAQESTAPATESAKFGTEGMSSDVVAEIRLARQKQEALWGLKGSEPEPGSLRKLPPDTAPELLQKIERGIEQREAKLDLEAMKQRYDALDSMPDPEIVIRDSAGRTRTLTTDELYQPTKTSELLEGTPQLQEYEVFIARVRETVDLRRAYDKEIALRRRLVEDAINEHASVLFPDSTVPNLSVAEISKSSLAEASYSRGAVKIRDEVLYKPFREHPEGRASKLADDFVHEATHGEQDGVIVRNFIDRVTGGDTTGRPLIAREIDEIVDLGKDRAGTTFPRELIEDINIKRAGKLLREEEAARAQQLESSFKANRTEGYRHQTDKLYNNRLKEEIEHLETGEVPLDFFSAKYQARLFGENPIPEKFETLSYIFENLLKPYSGKYNAEQQVMAANLKRLVVWALKDEKAVAFERVLKNQDEYRGWYHEKEAWRIGEQASKQVTEREILQGDRMQNWMDKMLSNPVDYGDVLAY